MDRGKRGGGQVRSGQERAEVKTAWACLSVSRVFCLFSPFAVWLTQSALKKKKKKKKFLERNFLVVCCCCCCWKGRDQFSHPDAARLRSHTIAVNLRERQEQPKLCVNCRCYHCLISVYKTVCLNERRRHRHSVFLPPFLPLLETLFIISHEEQTNKQTKGEEEVGRACITCPRRDGHSLFCSVLIDP